MRTSRERASRGSEMHLVGNVMIDTLLHASAAGAGATHSASAWSRRRPAVRRC